MEQCTVETGLLKKKPCGEKAVTKCANCEQPLCSKHAVPQMSAGHKTFLCPECAKAWKQSEKTVGTLPPTPAAAPAARKPAEATPKPAPVKPAPVKPAAVKPAPVKPAPVKPAAPVQRKAEPPPVEKSGPLEFTPAATKPAEAAPRPAAVKPAPVKPAPVKPAAPVQRKVEPPPVEKSAPLEFTPSEKKPAEDSGPLEFTLEPTDPKDKK